MMLLKAELLSFLESIDSPAFECSEEIQPPGRVYDLARDSYGPPSVIKIHEREKRVFNIKTV